MEVKTLKSFLAVAEHKSFSIAAKMRHTVQPTISRHISDLENELGVKLFQRNTHQVGLTPAGELLEPEAIKIIANDKRVRELMSYLGDNQINIGYLATACAFFLPKIINQTKHNNNKIITNLYEMTVKQQHDALLKQEIDLAFSRYQPKLSEQLFNIHEIYVDKLIAILPQSHHLAHKKSLHIDELKDERFIFFERSTWKETYDSLLELCVRNNFSPNIVSYSNNMRHLVTSISSGSGVSIAPSCIQSIANSSCVYIPVQEITIKWPLYMYYLKNNQTAQQEAFIHTCLQSVPEIKNMLRQLST